MTAPTTTRRATKWLPGADGLRAIAATSVFLTHAGFLTGATFESHAGGVLARLDVGVTVFFALSGFLLARPYVAAILDGSPLPGMRHYLSRRFLRIVPAYWVALTLTYVWFRPDSVKDATPLDRVLHYLFLQIYPAGTFPKGISAAWTLAVEMSFYLALPLLALGGARLVARQQGVSRRAILLLGGIGTLALLSLVYRAAIYLFELPLQAALWLPGTFAEFAVGLAAAVLAQWAVRRELGRSAAEALGRHDLLWWTLAALLLVFSASQIGLARGLDHASWNRELFGELSDIGVATLLLLPVAFGPQDRGLVRRVLRSWPLASFGLISYGFFLFHVPLIELAIELTGREMFLDWSQGIGIFSADVLHPVGLAFLLAVAAGTLSWFLLEKPLIGHGRSRLRAERRAAAAGDTASDPPVLEQAAP